MPNISVLPLPPPGAIEVWRLDLDAGDAARLEAQLTPVERARADRFVFPEGRRRFVAGRALVRQILGRYLGLPPGRVPIGLGHGGKPLLAPPSLVFSYSKSGPHGVLAVAGEGWLGVDLEQVAPLPDLALTVARVCSPAEQAGLDALPPDGVLPAFYRIWTLKEALLKATGDGVVIDLTAITIDADMAHLIDGPAPYRPEAWHLRRVDLGPGIKAALAHDRPIVAVVDRTA